MSSVTLYNVEGIGPVMPVEQVAQLIGTMADMLPMQAVKDSLIELKEAIERDMVTARSLPVIRIDTPRRKRGGGYCQP